jgi:hypothetical protein
MHCGSKFTTSRQHARYCCEGCKKAAERQRNKRQKKDAKGNVTGGQFTRVCAHCGAEYQSASPRGRYCSNACKQAAYRERKERQATS